MTGAPPSPGVVEAARGLAAIREIIDAWSDLAADPTKWPALTELPPFAHSALSLIWAQVEEYEASLSTVQPTTGGGGDRGWLIERSGQWYAAAPHTSWTLRQAVNSLEPENWTHDANEALRFARQCDAETLIRFVGWQNATATEHVFIDTRTPSGEADEAAFEAMRPRAWTYPYADPTSGQPVWRMDGELWNGQRPTASEPLFDLAEIRAFLAARRSRPSPDEMAKGEDKGSFDPRIHVPGVWRCAKCQFRLIQSNLNARDGSVTARDEAGEPCPNCATPLWRVTWREEAEDCLRNEETVWERGLEAGKRYVADEMAAEVGRLRAALNDIAEMCPATQEISTATLMGSIAAQALSSEGPGE